MRGHVGEAGFADDLWPDRLGSLVKFLVSIRRKHAVRFFVALDAIHLAYLERPGSTRFADLIKSVTVRMNPIALF